MKNNISKYVRQDVKFTQELLDSWKEFYRGFDFACQLLEDLGYTRSSTHPYNIADCMKAKMNRLPKSKIRKNEFADKDKDVILKEIERRLNRGRIKRAKSGHFYSYGQKHMLKSLRKFIIKLKINKPQTLSRAREVWESNLSNT